MKMGRIAGAALSAAMLALIAAPTAIAKTPVDAPPAPPPSSAPAVVKFTVPGPTTDSPGIQAECRIEQNGYPHVRTSTRGAGVKASVNCTTPVDHIEITGEMYYYWGDWLPQSGSPISFAQNWGASTLGNDRTSSAPCSSQSPTWWYGEFHALMTPVAGAKPQPLSLTSTSNEIPCAP
ncbi:hypothetical protein HUO13_35570 [Saccharopolyspora erythraea]|uniref:hypothetical protein n=1 Tax=Saccharopolyspora erythraea TaxID=1836 RepID=UPI001BAE2DDA|nr:hypothetical protein [Saccharopolyspora erythraea]QUH05394.1 hypothetical protein HUO13_35570 [Saccharopolyspora erythraea]